MSSFTDVKPRKAVVVGAGPVGCLAALSLAKQGWYVDVYESRADPRLPESKAASQNKSINLTISHRGIAAMQVIDAGIMQRFLHESVPMQGRMIHSESGEVASSLYDRDGQCLQSISRSLINEGCLDEAAASDKIRLFFNHKLISADFDNKTLQIKVKNASDLVKTVPFDFCVGADGSHSKTRKEVMKVVRMDYSQEYIKDLYIELTIPAGEDKNGEAMFQLDPNYLHVWPRHSFVLLALPNKDKSFTCSLFAPSAVFDNLKSETAVIGWFRTHFPDALTLLGEKNVGKEFIGKPKAPLMHIRAKPYHYKDRVVLLGDAAHAMVPFYGQGLNCGLEDIRILSLLFSEEGVKSATPFEPKAPTQEKETVDEQLLHALEKFSETRHEDVVAMCDMAMENYVGLRHTVATSLYYVQKSFDTLLYNITCRAPSSLNSFLKTLARVSYPPLPRNTWIPIYTMVAFRPDISYADARRKGEYQARMFGMLVSTCVGGLSLAAAYGSWSVWNKFMARALQLSV